MTLRRRLAQFPSQRCSAAQVNPSASAQAVGVRVMRDAFAQAPKRHEVLNRFRYSFVPLRLHECRSVLVINQ